MYKVYLQNWTLVESCVEFYIQRTVGTCLLFGKKTSISDWRMFADELGYSNSEIVKMMSINRQRERRERTVVLLLLIDKYYITRL